VCEGVPIPAFWPFAAAALGYAYTLAGRSDEGVPLVVQAVERAPSVLRLTLLAESYLGADRSGEAGPVADRALTLARYHKERGNEAWLLRLLGEIAARAQPPDVQAAERYYRAARALAEELGMRPLVAHCHLGLGTLYQKAERDQAARRELAAAAELYHALAMPLWLAKAEAALADAAG
jgi:hypothetical protein